MWGHSIGYSLYIGFSKEWKVRWIFAAMPKEDREVHPEILVFETPMETIKNYIFSDYIKNRSSI